MTTRHATCSCGQVDLTVVGEPVRISMCHCLECQRTMSCRISSKSAHDRATSAMALSGNVRDAFCRPRVVGFSGRVPMTPKAARCGSTAGAGWRPWRRP